MAALPPVSFIGLGAMGFGMATNLIKQGYTVTGFDVYPPTLERFAQAGGLTATTPSEAVVDKPLCVCMVATAQQAQAVLIEGPNAAIETLPKGAVVLLTSTVPAAYAQGLEKELVARGRADVRLVDSPVSGGVVRAAEGTLSIMAGASEEALAAARTLLEVMADPKQLYIVPGGVGGGSNLKMCHQVLAASQILSASEAMGFADHLGLDLKEARTAILGSEGWSWMFEHRSPRMLHPEFKPLASAVNIIMKDTSIITAEARRVNFPTHMTSTAEQVYFTGIGRGFGGDDDSSLIRLYNEGKGKLGPLKGKVETKEEKLKLVIDLLRGIHLCSTAETLAFAHTLGLDLNQVLTLCVNAAGASKLLSQSGPEMTVALTNGMAPEGWIGENKLSIIAEDLEKVVAEAQAIKCPLFLGAQALNLIRVALIQGGEVASKLDQGSVISAWL